MLNHKAKPPNELKYKHYGQNDMIKALHINKQNFNFGMTQVSAEPEREEIWPRLDRPKNAVYISPAFQELNNRVPKIKAKKKQWNT